MRRHLFSDALFWVGTGAVWIFVSIPGFDPLGLFHGTTNLLKQIIGAVGVIGGVCYCVVGLKRLAILSRYSHSGLRAAEDFRIEPNFKGSIARITGRGACLLAIGTKSKHRIEIKIAGPNAADFKPPGTKVIRVARGASNMEPFHYVGDPSCQWAISIEVAVTKSADDPSRAHCLVELYGNGDSIGLKNLALDET